MAIQKPNNHPHTEKSMKYKSNPEMNNFICPLIFLLILLITPWYVYPGKAVVSEEVSLEVSNAVLSGTLTLPAGRGPHPAILLLCGSGEQSRDWDIDGDGRYRLGLMLAEALNQSGTAVLRLDDRGTGKSTGLRESLTSFDTLKEDALAAIAFIRQRPDISRTGIGGFSSGAEIAVMAAAESRDVDFLVLLSGPFVAGADILMAQGRIFPEAFVPVPPENQEDLIAQALHFQELCINAARGGNTEELRNIIRRNTRYFLNKLPAEELEKFESFDAEVEKQTNEIVSGFQSDWYKSFADYNPAIDLKSINCPILAIYGANDNRVNAENGWKSLMRTLAENQESSSLDVSIRVFPATNHFLTSRDYALKGKMMPGITSLMSGWIKETIRNQELKAE